MEQQPQHQQQQQLWVFELCALGGVPISIHYTMLLLVVVQVFAATLSYQDRTYNALMFLLYGPILLITAFIHELGHVVAARNLGGFVDRIVLWPLGGFTVFGSTDGSVVDDLWIAISGPLTHVLQGAFWLGIYALINGGDLSSFSTSIQRQDLRSCGVGEFTSILSEQALLFNVVIFILNVCIPAYPFDGGRALAALLVMGGHKLGATARITAALGTFVGIVMLFVGVYWYVTRTSAGSLLLILVAGFIISSGSRMWKAAVSNRLYDHPLFQLECYRNRSSRRAPTSTSAATAPSRSSEVPVVINSHVI